MTFLVSADLWAIPNRLAQSDLFKSNLVGARDTSSFRVQNTGIMREKMRIIYLFSSLQLSD